MTPTYRYVFAIGTAMTPTNLEALATPVIPPKSTFFPSASKVTLADGSDRAVGAPTATWHWGFLRQTQRDMLRTFCPGTSATVYIRTYTKDLTSAPKYYQAVMHWPTDAEETDASRRIDFTIKFDQMVLQADP